MPLTIRCPSCRELFDLPRVTDQSSRARCPHCDTRFAVNDVTSVAVAETIPNPSQLPENQRAPQMERGTMLGGFQIIERIGKGGMGTVYKAIQISLDRAVAVKVMARRLSSDRHFVARFLRESRVMSELNHPNIVTVYDRNREGNVLYFVMEFIDGPSLRQVLRSAPEGRLRFEHATRIIRQVGEGLAYAHARGVIHRDIKPGNILLTEDGGVPKISDFGIAAAVGEVDGSLTRTGSDMGSAVYTSPEQHEDAGSVDAQTDVYSLGVLLYEMSTGKLPVGAYKSPSQIDNSLPTALDDTLDTALASDKTERYRNVECFLADLHGLSSEESVRTTEPKTEVRGEKWSGKLRKSAASFFRKTSGKAEEKQQQGKTGEQSPESLNREFNGVGDDENQQREFEEETAEFVRIADSNSNPPPLPPSRSNKPPSGKSKSTPIRVKINSSNEPWRKQLLGKITCPNCWHVFRPEKVKFIAKHPELVGDPIAGDNEYRRFLPMQFNVSGEAIDPNGYPTTELACPHCHLRLSDAAPEVRPFFVSIVGSPASGKSYFLTAMAWKLRHVLPRARITFTDADPTANSVINDYERTLFFNSDPQEPTEIVKTQPDDPRLHQTVMIDELPMRFPLPLQFTMRPNPGHPCFDRAHKFARNIVLYDNAGEDYLPSSEDVTSAATRHLAKSNIIFMLFDPTQEPGTRDMCDHNDPQLKHGFRPDGSLPSVLLRQETLLREVSVRIRRYHGMSQGERIKRPLIIVVPKFDVWEGRVGFSITDEPYVFNGDTAPFAVQTELVEQASDAIRDVLERHCPEFVAAAENLSSTVVYIPVSSLGRSPDLVTRDGRTFYGIRPEDLTPQWTTVPLLYSLSKWAKGLIPRASTDIEIG